MVYKVFVRVTHLEQQASGDGSAVLIRRAKVVRRTNCGRNANTRHDQHEENEHVFITVGEYANAHRAALTSYIMCPCECAHTRADVRVGQGTCERVRASMHIQSRTEHDSSGCHLTPHKSTVYPTPASESSLPLTGFDVGGQSGLGGVVCRLVQLVADQRRFRAHSTKQLLADSAVHDAGGRHRGAGEAPHEAGVDQRVRVLVPQHDLEGVDGVRAWRGRGDALHSDETAD